jgi:hypothetical protein
MATTEQVLAEAVAALAASRQSEPGAVLATEIGQLRAASAQQADAIVENTQAVLQNTIAKATGGQSAAGAAGKWALGFVTGGMSPLITGLVKLFTGGEKTETPPPLVAYSRPAPVVVEGEMTDRERVVWRTADTAQARPSAATQVTVQVQAMDSRSFLEHRDEIARAVRQAVLSSHSLNDVLADV